MIKYEKWAVSAEGYKTHGLQFLESIFSQANGYMGARAGLIILNPA